MGLYWKILLALLPYCRPDGTLLENPACITTILTSRWDFIGKSCLHFHHTVVPMGLAIEQDYILESSNQMNPIGMTVW
jgi:hypothetical protein